MRRNRSTSAIADASVGEREARGELLIGVATDRWLVTNPGTSEG